MKDYYDYVKNILSEIYLKEPCYLNHNHNHKERLLEAENNNYTQIFVNVENSPVPQDIVESSKCIIEYSCCNVIAHTKKLNYYKEYAEKFIYLPFIANTDEKMFSNSSRTNIYDIVSSFYNIRHEKRQNVINTLSSDKSIKYINIEKTWGENICDTYYSKSKILLNIHANNSFRVLEEIRVLPALLSQAIIISEQSLYSENLPYKDYIIWTDYENSLSTCKDVLKNYNYFFNKIFTTSFFFNFFKKIKTSSLLNLKNIFD